MPLPYCLGENVLLGSKRHVFIILRRHGFNINHVLFGGQKEGHGGIYVMLIVRDRKALDAVAFSLPGTKRTKGTEQTVGLNGIRPVARGVFLCKEV